MNAPEIHSIFATASFAGLAAATLLQVASMRQLMLPQGQLASAVAFLIGAVCAASGRMGSCRLPANLSVISPASAMRKDTLARLASFARRSWTIASEPKTAVVQKSPLKLGPAPTYGP